MEVDGEGGQAQINLGCKVDRDRTRGNNAPSGASARSLLPPPCRIPILMGGQRGIDGNK